MTERGDTRGGPRLEPVVDPGAAPIAAHDPGLAQDLEVVRDRGLTHAAAIGEVAGADLSVRGELAHDREPGRLGDRLEDLDVVHACHYIHKLRY